MQKLQLRPPLSERLYRRTVKFVFRAIVRDEDAFLRVWFEFMRYRAGGRK